MRAGVNEALPPLEFGEAMRGGSAYPLSGFVGGSCGILPGEVEDIAGPVEGAGGSELPAER